MNTDRLLILADHLETVPEDQFDMNTWYSNDCGTSACIMGHACSVPEFQALGLRLEGEAWSDFDFYVTINGLKHERTAMELFELDLHTANGLVYGSHSTPKEAVAYIRNLVAESQQ